MRQPLSLLVSHWEAHETRKGGGDPSCDPGPAGGAERGAWALDGVTPAFQTLRTGLPHGRASWASAPGLVGGPGCCCRVRGACPAGVWGSGEAKSPRLRRHFTRCWRASPLFGLLPSSGAFTCFIRSAPGAQPAHAALPEGLLRLWASAVPCRLTLWRPCLCAVRVPGLRCCTGWALHQVAWMTTAIITLAHSGLWQRPCLPRGGGPPLSYGAQRHPVDSKSPHHPKNPGGPVPWCTAQCPLPCSPPPLPGVCPSLLRSCWPSSAAPFQS